MRNGGRRCSQRLPLGGLVPGGSLHLCSGEEILLPWRVSACPKELLPGLRDARLPPPLAPITGAGLTRSRSGRPPRGSGHGAFGLLPAHRAGLREYTRPFGSHLGAAGQDGGTGSPRPARAATPPSTRPQPRGTAPTDAGTGKDSPRGRSEPDRPPRACRSCVCSTTPAPPHRRPRPPGARLSRRP